MAETLVSDVIVPDVFMSYFRERTAERSELIQSGILRAEPEFSALANGGGSKIDMPFWQDLTGADEVLSDTSPLTAAKITTAKDIATLHQRGKAWATNTLAKWMAGDDPMAAIADRLADYWERRRQALILSTLKGVFLASDASMDGNKSVIHHTTGGGPATASESFTGKTFIDAKQLLGDVGTRLTAMIVHSAVEANLRKQDLIDFIVSRDGITQIPVFQGLRVLIDDTTPSETIDSDVVYTSYLFGQGAFGLGEADINTPVEGGHGTEALEFTRTALAHTTTLIQRERTIIHPRGVAFQSASVAGLTPTNAELETSTNWARVFEAKNVRIVQFRTNLLPI